MDTNKLISISREEYSAFVTDATETVIAKFREKGLDFPDRGGYPGPTDMQTMMRKCYDTGTERILKILYHQ